MSNIANKLPQEGHVFAFVESRTLAIADMPQAISLGGGNNILLIVLYMKQSIVPTVSMAGATQPANNVIGRKELLVIVGQDIPLTDSDILILPLEEEMTTKVTIGCEIGHFSYIAIGHSLRKWVAASSQSFRPKSDVKGNECHLDRYKMVVNIV
ncbi:hypothetical protein Tco_0149305 [Tanacetum coccineum]